MVYYSNESKVLLENMSSDEQSDKECPLCMEPFEIDDINFYPCKCEYQICRFCWHRLRTDENGLCPACRQPYPEDPVNFQPLTSADVRKLKSEKKQKLQQQKNKMSETRKHLSAYRVLQKNLVYVVGLSQKMADAETLKKIEYFGRFGKIMKVAVGAPQHQTLACTAYVTYYKIEDALKAIQSVNNAVVDGRMIKASLGTTKYCSNFLKGQICHKQECMYLHAEAPLEISFTKEDMQVGKHTEYEKKLLEQLFPNAVPEQRKKYRNSSEKNVQKADRSLVNGSEYTEDLNEKKDLSEPPPESGHSCNKHALVHKRSESREAGKSLDDVPSISSRESTPDNVDDGLIFAEKETHENTNEMESLPNCNNSLHNNALSSYKQTDEKRRVSFDHDDDLGFDPFSESSKALADLLEEEKSTIPYRENSSLTHMSNPFYSMGVSIDNSNQPILPPPGFSSQSFGQNNFSSSEISFLQSLRSSNSRAGPDHNEQLSYGIHQQPQSNIYSTTGMSFFERLRTRQADNAFQQHPQLYPHQGSSSFFNGHPQYGENVETSRSTSMLAALHGVNDSFAMNHRSNSQFEHSLDVNLHADISHSQQMLQQPTQVHDWREEFKALLGPSFGNVNVHFASDMDTYLSTISDGKNVSNRKHDPYYDNFGKSASEPLEQLFSNQATISQQQFPPPPGFSSQSRM